VHQPSDAACGSAECGPAVCDPGHADADERGCIVSAGEGDACADDGVACTVDTCSAGQCRHEPDDARCGGGDECRQAACEPASPEADAHGCVAEAPRASGDECSDDEDPCTDDLCRDLGCAHELVANEDGCAPVRVPFQRARRLLILLQTLETQMAAALSPAQEERTDNQGSGMLHAAAADLEAAARALAGKSVTIEVGPPLMAEPPAQARARLAADILRRTPSRIASALRRARAHLHARETRGIRPGCRELLRGTRALRAHLRRMTRVTGTLVR
jgi:hypothetical protein